MIDPLTTLTTNLQLLDTTKSGRSRRSLSVSQNLDVLLILDLSATAHRTHVNHSAQQLYRPTVDNDSVRFRNMIYVNGRVSPAPLRPTGPLGNQIWTDDSQILLFSVCIPPVPMHAFEEASAETALSAIQGTQPFKDNRRPTSGTWWVEIATSCECLTRFAKLQVIVDSARVCQRLRLLLH
ncbi:hypothetical protein PENSUB_13816 [Penicillium subrubescens]|jgi:hypothetical protein|uniref:Uncharacterized protein n=1 Tax=Penicillium subrubescens TaxID=1316194 RepID=A0A1Q5SMP9_9EURO|nr:hypothetical protein PENSUB_13816 [Penicillium subrubescens]